MTNVQTANTEGTIQSTTLVTLIESRVIDTFFKNMPYNARCPFLKKSQDSWHNSIIE